MQLVAHVARFRDGIEQQVHGEGEGNAEGQPAEQTDQGIEQRARTERAARGFGLIHKRDFALPDPACNAHFLVALQQGVIERAVGVRFALEDVVLDRTPPIEHDLALGFGHLLAQLFLDPDRGLEFAVKLGALVGGGATALGPDGSVQPVDPGLQLGHGRIVGFVDLQFLVVLRLKVGTTLDQRGNAGGRFAGEVDL